MCPDISHGTQNGMSRPTTSPASNQEGDSVTHKAQPISPLSPACAGEFELCQYARHYAMSSPNPKRSPAHLAASHGLLPWARRYAAPFGGHLATLSGIDRCKGAARSLVTVVQGRHRGPVLIPCAQASCQTWASPRRRQHRATGADLACQVMRRCWALSRRFAVISDR